MKIYFTRDGSGHHSSSLVAKKLCECFSTMGVGVTFNKKDKFHGILAFINVDDFNLLKKRPVIQRLDGIYFDKDTDYVKRNSGILKTYKESSGIIFQSNVAKKLVFSIFGETKKPFEIIHNGTYINTIGNSEKFLLDKKPEIYSKLIKFEKRIICCGKFRKIKRLPSIISGSYEYIKNNKNTALYIIGTIEGDEERDALNKYSSLSENIIYLGKQENDVVRNIQSMCDVGISLSFVDACPSSVIEQLVYGVPVVSTKFQGTNELFNEDSGVVMDVDDWNYSPIRYRDIKQIDPLLTAKAIEKCFIIGKREVRKDLDVSLMAKKYATFIKGVIGT